MPADFAALIYVQIDDGDIRWMKKYSALLAAAALLVSSGIAAAQSRNYDSSGAPKSAPSGQRSGGGLATGSTTGAGGNTGMAGPSSTNPQAGGTPTAPRQVPENGGAPNSTMPKSR
jgi:hypothetical protein